MHNTGQNRSPHLLELLEVPTHQRSVSHEPFYFFLVVLGDGIICPILARPQSVSEFFASARESTYFFSVFFAWHDSISGGDACCTKLFFSPHDSTTETNASLCLQGVHQRVPSLFLHIFFPTLSLSRSAVGAKDLFRTKY